MRRGGVFGGSLGIIDWEVCVGEGSEIVVDVDFFLLDGGVGGGGNIDDDLGLGGVDGGGSRTADGFAAVVDDVVLFFSFFLPLLVGGRIEVSGAEELVASASFS